MPTLLATLPVAVALCDWTVVILHGAFQLLAGRAVIEAMFWAFDRVPFTCSYSAGRTNLSRSQGIYLYGFNHSLNLAALERRIETDGVLAGIVFTVAAVLLAYAWQRKPPGAQLRFDWREQTYSDAGSYVKAVGPENETQPLRSPAESVRLECPKC